LSWTERVHLLRNGTGEPVLFLYDAGGAGTWLPFYEIPRRPRVRGDRARPPLIRQIGRVPQARSHRRLRVSLPGRLEALGFVPGRAPVDTAGMTSRVEDLLEVALGRF
jgi:hypothetical protein